MSEPARQAFRANKRKEMNRKRALRKPCTQEKAARRRACKLQGRVQQKPQVIFPLSSSRFSFRIIYNTSYNFCVAGSPGREGGLDHWQVATTRVPSPHRRRRQRGGQPSNGPRRDTGRPGWWCALHRPKRVYTGRRRPPPPSRRDARRPGPAVRFIPARARPSRHRPAGSDPACRMPIPSYMYAVIYVRGHSARQNAGRPFWHRILHHWGY